MNSILYTTYTCTYTHAHAHTCTQSHTHKHTITTHAHRFTPVPLFLRVRIGTLVSLGTPPHLAEVGTHSRLVATTLNLRGSHGRGGVVGEDVEENVGGDGGV